MFFSHHTWLRAPVAFALTAFVLLASGTTRAAPAASFSEDVFPIIQIRCMECHKPDGEGYEKSGLDLSNYEGLMKGTKHGPMVIPGDPVRSNFMVMIDGRAKIRMPHGKRKLSSCEIREIRRWIKQGAKDN